MKSRKTTIKKPKFLIPYFISVIVLLAVFTTAGVIYFLPEYYVYNFNVMQSASWREETIAKFLEEVLTEPELSGNDLAYAKENLINHYCETGVRYEVIIDGKDRVDTSRDAILTYTYRAPDGDGDRAYFQLADKAYLKYFDTPEVQAESFIDKEYSQYFTHSPKIEFECREFYADLEKGVFIPVSVRIIDSKGDDTDVSFKIEPKDTEGMTLINPEYDGFMFATGTVAGDPFGGGSLENIGHLEYENGNMSHNFTCRATGASTIPFRTAYKSALLIAIILVCCGAFILAFVPAAIIYNTRKRRYEIFEYRLKMVDAMAHDLKTPMAAVSAYAENLSNHIGTDKQEYYAAKVEEKVAQMNRMVNDILEFSKSERQTAEISKENVDVGDVIAELIADNELMIKERSLKIGYEKKSVVVSTDRKLFRMALANLINNAVFYSKEGTQIDISLDEKDLIIINISEEKTDKAENLKDPFVKGSRSRGSGGTGLGLAIANNNLAMLGFKLEIQSKDDKFIATVKL